MGDDLSEINPNLTFPPIPDRYNRCDTESCYCVAYNNASCPWDLDDFPSDAEGLLSASDYSEMTTSTGNHTSIDFLPFTTLRFCDAKSIYYEADDDFSTSVLAISPSVYECGIFFYVQLVIQRDNYYARGGDIQECAKSWEDVPVPVPTSSAAVSASALFLPIPLILLLALVLIT